MVEFDIIASFYGGKIAQRSRVPSLNHIKEGLFILQHEKASLPAQRAYCLHPLLQSDEALQENYATLAYAKIDSKVMLLALEYRNIANQYLSRRQVQNIDEIQLSPLDEVNQMLVADKIQNCKDFELHHKTTHLRSKELTIYFANWFMRLGISDEKYQHYKCTNLLENIIFQK